MINSDNEKQGGNEKRKSPCSSFLSEKGRLDQTYACGGGATTHAGGTRKDVADEKY